MVGFVGTPSSSSYANSNILQELLELEKELDKELESKKDPKVIREIFEGYILDWPNVKKKKFFGKPGYFVEGKLFAFFEDEKLVMTKLTSRNRDKLYREFGRSVFEYPDRKRKSWLMVTLKEENLDKTLVYSSLSYFHALSSIKRSASSDGI